MERDSRAMKRQMRTQRDDRAMRRYARDIARRSWYSKKEGLRAASVRARCSLVEHLETEGSVPLKLVDPSQLAARFAESEAHKQPEAAETEPESAAETEPESDEEPEVIETDIPIEVEAFPDDDPDAQVEAIAYEIVETEAEAVTSVQQPEEVFEIEVEYEMID